MTPDNLSYEPLKSVLAPFEAKGRGEARAFLNWFLENIFRLDPIAADDSICDKPNDRGIDGIVIDDTQEEILILQGKIRQKESSIGDPPLRDLCGTLDQLASAETVQALLDGGANEDLKALLIRYHVKSLVEKGYKVVGVFVSNQPLDANGKEYLDQTDRLRVYDRVRIASEFIDVELEGGVAGTYSFDASYVEPLVLAIGKSARALILPVLATELVAMQGITDGTLFSQNVRQALGNTKVNKALRASVRDKAEHVNFPLYHNGINILCEAAKIEGGRLVISNYVVVNGAQSITTFAQSASDLSSDLRVIAKVIELSEPSLARKISVNSNNQNAIKPRDLKSTNELQLRLKEEFNQVFGKSYRLEIKRGEDTQDATSVITNEEAGLLLLASDLMEPYSCHQVYRLFDDKYNDIFARPAVTAHRIVLLNLIMQRIRNSMADIEYRPLAGYGLTRFFLLSVVTDILRNDNMGMGILREPRKVFDDHLVERTLSAIDEILTTLVVDLNYEVAEKGEAFNYKSDLKSPNRVKELRTNLVRSFDKDVARKKARTFEELLV